MTYNINFLSVEQKLPEQEILEFAKTQLTLPDKIDPSDAMSWQHHLYSKLGSKKPATDENDANAKNTANLTKQQLLDELVGRINAMAKVLYGLHMVSYLLSCTIDIIPQLCITLLISRTISAVFIRGWVCYHGAYLVVC